MSKPYREYTEQDIWNLVQEIKKLNEQLSAERYSLHDIGEDLEELYEVNQELKQENEELKKKLKTIYDILDVCEKGNCSDCKYEDCDDCTSLNHNDILQLIKQTKEVKGE